MSAISNPVSATALSIVSPSEEGPKERKYRVRRLFEEFVGKDDFLVALSYGSVVSQCC